MGADVYVAGWHMSFSLLDLAMMSLSAVALIAGGIATCELLYRRLTRRSQD